MTRLDAIAAAGRVQAQAYQLMQQLPARDLAERAWTPGGPPLGELEQRIHAWRGDDIRRAA